MRTSHIEDILVDVTSYALSLNIEQEIYCWLIKNHPKDNHFIVTHSPAIYIIKKKYYQLMICFLEINL